MSHEGQCNELASTDGTALSVALIKMPEVIPTQTHVAGNFWKGLSNAALFVAPFWVIIVWLPS
jgi:hypothetical protein